MKIITIIVTYNPMKWIDKCLLQLRNSTISTEIVIVDNCSCDGAREYIPEKYPDIIWMPQDKNLGFGQGNNVGIKYALKNNADYVLLLNQDAYLDINALEKLLKVSDGKSLLSPLHLTGDGSKLDWNFKGALYHNRDMMLTDDALVKKTVAMQYKLDEVCAACWFIPIEVIKSVGGFNKNFFHYGEDNNYAQRLKYFGIDTYIVTSTYMCHDRGEQGNMEAYNNMRVRRDILIVCCNINCTFASIMYGLLKAVIKLYREELSRHNYKIGSFLVELLYVIFHLNNVVRSRKIDKKKGLSWLQE